ncbi:MAG: PAS domain S-box protein [Parcubacteria group bacterium]|jgi:PAS domain S-box-containing protein
MKKKIFVIMVSAMVFGIATWIVHDRYETFTGEFFLGITLLSGVIISFLCTRREKEKKEHENIIRQLQENTVSCNKSQLEIYFLHTPLAVIEWNLDFTVRSWNDKAQEIFGYCAQEMIGKHAKCLVPVCHQDKIVAVGDNLLKGGLGQENIFKNITKDGRIIYCEWINTPIKERTGCILSVYSLVQDITQKYCAENDLRDSQEKLDRILSALHDLVFVIEDDGRISYANAVAHDLVGVPMERRGNVHFSEILSDDDQKIARRRIELAIKTQRVLSPQVYHLRKIDEDNADVPVEIVAVPFVEGGKQKVLGVARVISDRLELDEKRSQEERMQSIGVMAGGIAHDFNNLLMVIEGHASMLKMNGLKDADRHLESIMTAVQRSVALTQQLRTFAKGGVSVKEVTSVARVIRETASLVLGSNSPSRCDCDFANDLKDSFVDPKQIGQVFQNLLINASHAMPNGGIIRVVGKNVKIDEENQLLINPGEYVQFSVQDSGIGIAHKYLSKIFEPYFTTKGSREGTGLGLTVAYSIIKEHGGYISVESALGEGTTFHVYLPATTSKELGVVVVKEKEGRNRSLSILHVEDQDANGDLMVEILHAFGHSCESVVDGSMALPLYKSACETGKCFDLVITNLTIPGGMGGLELIEKLRNYDKNVKFIITSGYAKNLPEEYKEIFLQKPFNISKMKELIDVVVNGR